MHTRTLVVTALGRGSFSPSQMARLDGLGPADVVARPETMTDDEFVELARPYDVVALTRRPMKYLHRSVLSRLAHLRFLVVHTTGTHWIDGDHLAGRGVRLLSLGGYATESVAEHTLAGLLMLSRRTHLSIDRSRGLIPDTVSLRGFELRGRTAGLIGYGRIGRRIHELLTPFDMTVLIHDPAHQGSVPFDEVLGRAELVVVAASQQYGRDPIIDRRALAVSGARYIVNVACDELVDHQAIVEAVEARRLDGYLLDELDEVLSRADVEPGRIVQTMHTGWYSDESMERGRAEWIDLIEQAVTEAEAAGSDRERRAA